MGMMICVLILIYRGKFEFVGMAANYCAQLPWLPIIVTNIYVSTYHLCIYRYLMN